MQTSVSGTCHVKTLQVIHGKSQNWFKHLLKYGMHLFVNSVKQNINYNVACVTQV